MEQILDHIGNSAWRGRLEFPNFSGFSRNSFCGDEINVELIVGDSTIRQIRYQGRGCVLSLACASLVCESIQGRSIDDAARTFPESLLGFETNVLSWHKRRCVVLGWEALQLALSTIINDADKRYAKDDSSTAFMDDCSAVGLFRLQRGKLK